MECGPSQAPAGVVSLGASGGELGHSRSPDRQAYERKIVDRFGGQKEFEFIVPEIKEAAN